MDLDKMVEAEYARLCALDALAVLDTPQEERFDRLTRLASQTLSVPIALVSLVDRERQWFKSRVGLEAVQTPRSMAFCSHAVAARNMLVVDDATLDARFTDNPLVTGAPHIRFYAGQPVYSHDGHAVGTLCVIDTRPRSFNEAQRQALRDFAVLVQDELNKAALVAARDGAQVALHALNSELEQRIEERTRSLKLANASLQEEMRRRELVESTLRASEERIRTIIDSSFVAFISVDASGTVVDWNPSAERTFGWIREEAIGLDLATLIMPERHRHACRQGLAAILAGAPGAVLDKRIELRALTRLGEEITVAMTVTAFEAGGARYVGAFVHDVSEEHKAERALAEKRELLVQKQELLDAILDTVDVGVVACAADGALSLMNRAAREFHGLAHEHPDSEDWARQYSLFKPDGTTLLEQAEIPLFRALQGETLRDTAMVIAPPGLPQRFVLASGRRLANAAGQPLGAVIAMKDVTELNQYQRQLAQKEQRLRDITDNVPALIGHIDHDGCFTFLNSPALHFYGKTGQNLIGAHLTAIYSASEFEKFAPFIARAQAGERVEFEDHIVIRGKSKYFHASYIPDRNADGRMQGFYALALDITARKNSELRQADSEERLRTIANNLPVLIAYVDSDMRYRFANALYQQWMNKDPAAMLGHTDAELFGDAHAAARAPQLAECFAGRASHADYALDGTATPRIVNTAFIPHLRDGQVVGAYLFSTDVTAVRQHEATLHCLANSDTLTGLPNRRGYEARLQEATQSARRNGRAIALMILDIDHFKQINDSWGHAGGDQVLQEFARRLVAVVRKSDTVCRLAGDEFTILLEGVPTMEICERLGENIVAAMREPFVAAGRQRQVSTSIGIAWCTNGSTDALHLSADADAALYEAKEAGRNRYRCRVAGSEQ